MNGYRLATHLRRAALNAPRPLSHQVAPHKNAHQTAFASSCASQKCFSLAFTSPRLVKTLTRSLSRRPASQKRLSPAFASSSCASQNAFRPLSRRIASQKRPAPAFTSRRPAKTPRACFHVASPAQALSDVRFNISFILYCDVDHGFVLSMIFCFFDPSTAGILAPLVAVGRFAPSAKRPQWRP